MDVFYEESALPRNAKKGKTMYYIAHGISIFFIVLAVLSFFFFFFFVGVSKKNLPEILFWLAMVVTYALMAFALYKFKQRFNVSYDYCFVSGEIRISKVINGRKRKLIVRLESAELIQMGDVEAPSFERFKTDPTIKTVICTPNDEAEEGKFFLYLLAENNGKKLFVIECREELLIHIMKFARRGTLDHDYVSQEKKKQQQV